MLATSNGDISCKSNGLLRPFLVERSALILSSFQNQPALPVLPATRLHLDLLLSQATLDLKSIAAVVLDDVGACLQLFRANRGARGAADQRTGRIEECVIHLGRKGLRQALSSVFPMEGRPRCRAVEQLWTRARLAAALSGTMAACFPEIRPSDAHLAGLLHEAGRIPALLGWTSRDLDLDDPVAVGRAMAREWALPAFVSPTLLLASIPRQSTTQLQRIVTVAWDLSNAICNRQPLPQRGIQRTPGGRSGSPVQGKSETSALPALRLVCF